MHFLEEMELSHEGSEESHQGDKTRKGLSGKRKRTFNKYCVRPLSECHFVLVCSRGHNKLPQTGWFIEQQYIFS